MKRRSYLKTILAAGAGLTAASAQTATPKGQGKTPIILYVDMQVDPAKEQELIKNFHTIFKPEAVKHPGYIDVTIAKLRSALMGTAPAGMNYRFQLTYQSEELRQKWIASPEHAKVWPTIENTLTSKNYTVLLCDVV
ncbi:MAG: hypothetical protein QOJ99_2381 [Bryobacterales bacterium]|jgi:hypothetical protein|nr:hypothetical protein [Bryobacterales bacterium]